MCMQNFQPSDLHSWCEKHPYFEMFALLHCFLPVYKFHFFSDDERIRMYEDQLTVQDGCHDEVTQLDRYCVTFCINSRRMPFSFWCLSCKDVRICGCHGRCLGPHRPISYHGCIPQAQGAPKPEEQLATMVTYLRPRVHLTLRNSQSPWLHNSGYKCTRPQGAVSHHGYIP